MVELSGKHAPIADDEESDGEFLPHHSPDAQSRQAVERRDGSREMSLVRYEDILPVVQTLSARFIICQYLTLGMTVMLCVYMTLMIFEAPQWLPSRPGVHDNFPSMTLREPSQEKPSQAAGDMRRGDMREVPAAKVTGAAADVSGTTLSRGNKVQSPKPSTDALERHDGTRKPQSRRKPRRLVRGRPAVSAPSSRQTSQTVLFPGASIHKDSEGRVDYWLVRREDGQLTPMVPGDVTKLGVVFRDMDNGHKYLLTFEGEWTKFRPN
jgi:hypothetical protein